jgi:hypothetical protein
LEDESREIVPVLLCDEKLPFKLRQWQWINLNGKVVHTCRAKANSQAGVFVGRRKTRDSAFRTIVASNKGKLDQVISISCKLQPPREQNRCVTIPDWIARRVPSNRAVALANRIESYFNFLGTR